MNNLNMNSNNGNRIMIDRNTLDELREIAASLHGEEAISEVSAYINAPDGATGKEDMGLYALKALCEFYTNTRFLQKRIDEALGIAD